VKRLIKNETMCGEMVSTVSHQDFVVIKFRKGWVKSFCPKLITLERYPYFGPFKTENEMKITLNNMNKHDSIT